MNNQYDKLSKLNETTHQSDSNLTRVLFTIQTDSGTYGVGLLGIKHSPAEMFYHSAWPKDAKRDLLDTSKNETTKRPDHFSWHADGNAHMRTSKKGILGHPWRFPDNSFLSKDSSSITPLLIHSVKVNDCSYDLPLLSEMSVDSYQIVQKMAVINAPQNFSVSIFLVPTHVTTNEVLSGMWVDFHLKGQPSLRLDLRNLCSDGFHPGRFKVQEWSGWDVLFVLSDLIMPIPSSAEPKNYFKVITIVNTPKCFEVLLAQRIATVEFTKKVDQDRSLKN
jgi:hypothetical protein